MPFIFIDKMVEVITDVQGTFRGLEGAIKKKNRFRKTETRKGVFFLLKTSEQPLGVQFLVNRGEAIKGGKCGGKIIYYYISSPLRTKGF